MSDESRRVHVGQTLLTAVVGKSELVVTQAQEVEDCGVQVGGIRAMEDGTVAEVVGGSIRLSSTNATAGQSDAEAIRVVVAALGTLGF